MTDIKNEQIKSQAQWDELYGLIDNANAPIIRVDKDLNITVWNDRIATLTGFSKEDWLG